MEQVHKRRWVLAIVVTLIAALIAVIFFMPSSNNVPPQSEKLWIGNSPVLGDKNAPVIIYVFSDFSCPLCAAAEGENEYYMNALKSKMPGWEAPLPLIKEQYVKTGKAKLVFKYFPGHGAGIAAQAVALGMYEQNHSLFWEFAEKAFSNQSTNLNDLGKMKEWALELGANETALSDYLAAAKYEAQMKEDINMGLNNSIKGTPSFFINNKFIEGAQSFSIFAKAIDEELAK